MAKKDLDVAALWIAVISLVLSVGAFGFSIYVFGVGRAESLSIEASLTFGRDELRCMPSMGDPVGLVQAPARVIISNNSDRTVSIVAYEVYETDSSARRMMYTSITSGITDSQGAPVSIPFSLAAGEGRRIEVLLGLMPEHSAKLRLGESSLCSSTFTRRQLMSILGRESIDLYGNAVSLREYPSGFVFTGPQAGGRQQEFVILFRTGRNSVFQAHTTWYPFAELSQRAF